MTGTVVNIQLDGIFTVFTIVHSCEESDCCHARLTLKYLTEKAPVWKIGHTLSISIG